MDKPTIKQIEEWKAGLNGMTKEDYNVISKPKHYMVFDKYQVKLKADAGEGVEVRDVIQKLVSKFDPPAEGMFVADYVQLMQYLMRFMDKNGKEDLEKARWYLDKMISAY